MKPILPFLVLLCMNSHISAQNKIGDSETLLAGIKAALAGQKGFFALAYKNIATGETILWNEHENFHAASTMKTPVMIEVFKQVAAGTLSLSDSIPVKNEFKSIVDGSVYQLNPADDSQQALYALTGTRQPLSAIVYEMIIQSSNLATNLIMEMVDGKKVTQTMRDLGAANIQVLRGVEDNKAFAKGLNNTTTAYDLMVIYEKLAKGEVVSTSSSEAMIQTLFDQKHNTLIPALLPKEVRVAHKTGSITGVHHDSGIIYLPDGRKYVLVILSKNLENEPAATEAMARVSYQVYQYVLKQPK